MKVLTANFVTCAVKACKTSSASYPLHFQDAELEQVEIDYHPEFLRNILPRLDWPAMQVTAKELGFGALTETKPEGDALNDEKLLRDLHRLLLETQVVEGKLVCANCGHIYTIKEGIPNFLLPGHLGESSSPAQSRSCSYLCAVADGNLTQSDCTPLVWLRIASTMQLVAVRLMPYCHLNPE
ncbi:hypothetical protein KEM52_002437 [Ascosphaera acerosa]|nr:hypothetical protein KEM52_002437 [Ascosphaera acerosa]